MSVFYELTEDQENDIDDVRLLFRLIVDLSCAVPPGKTVQLDPDSLIALLSVAEQKLPTAKDMRVVEHH